MSSSATIGGGFDFGPMKRRSMKSPPPLKLARRVRRTSIRWPRGCGASRRVRTSASGSTRRRIASLAAAISALVICAKSFFCSTSRSDTVMRVSSSISRSFFSLSSRPENKASCTRVAPASGGPRRVRRLRQHHRHELIDVAAAAEEDAERLVEKKRVLVPLHKHRVQRPVEILARADAGGLDRFERVEHRARADRDAGRTQRTGEVDDVFGEAAVGARPLLGRPLPLRGRLHRLTRMILLTFQVTTLLARDVAQASHRQTSFYTKVQTLNTDKRLSRQRVHSSLNDARPTERRPRHPSR